MPKTHHYAGTWIVRPAGLSVEYLLLRRAPHKYMGGLWSLVSGGIEPGEAAWQAALREMQEEAALQPLEFFRLSTLEQFYVPESDTLFIAPFFLAIVDATAQVVLNPENDAFRWFGDHEIDAALCWPGEHTMLAELRKYHLANHPMREYLRINI
jgi:dihydroneopterin triphosphate diphosphatase